MPATFNDKIAAVYSGMLITGRNHAADNARRIAEDKFSDSTCYTYRAVGFKEYELKSVYPAKRTLALDDERRVDVSYHAMARVPRKLLTRYGLLVMTMTAAIDRVPVADHVRRTIGNVPISLAINENWANPAAIIYPRMSEDSSAMVVVGNEINEPSDIEEVTALLLG